MSVDNASFPYEEPSIATILIQSSFLLLLNGINFILDKTVYCGLVGQLFIGVAYGSPGAKWLHSDAETVITDLGYLGLILLVFEGGLSTSITSLRANLFLSIRVALTGLGLPIALSFVLQPLTDATALQAFAAGAALCSTSLGTTFTVLQTSGLTTSRLGVVLTSAAMMDDVVGLVMVQVISELGGSAFTATTVIRPVFVSIAFAIMVPVCCWLVITPLTLRYQAWSLKQSGHLQKMLSQPGTPLILHLLILFGMVAAGSYAGTSNLFTAYLAGVAISWWDVLHTPSDVSSAEQSTPDTQSEPAVRSSATPGVLKDMASRGDIDLAPRSGMAIYEHYLQQAVNRILKPLFFASVGFSIPIRNMFNGPVVWRGIVYTSLMLLGKLACGLWLIQISITLPASLSTMPSRILELILELRSCFKLQPAPKKSKSATPTAETVQMKRVERRKSVSQSQGGPAIARAYPQAAVPSISAEDATTPNSDKATSLYPAAIVGTAMVARGEIGFLISSLAQSRGIFDSDGGVIFLVVTWAIMLCTILGPLAVGLLVKRVRRLEKSNHSRAGQERPRDVLGVWGVG
jgi:Kef-type K+ transport system membrane component KefB